MHIIKGKERKLNKLADQFRETENKDKNIYKEIGIACLKELDDYFDLVEFYNEKLLISYRKLVLQAKEIDR